MARPRNADGQRTRQAILDAALDLFAANGFFGTSLRDVASAVGVRESAIYNYFPGKDALFEAMLSAHQQSRLEQMPVPAEGPIADGRALLLGLTNTILNRYLDPGEQKLFRILMSDGIRLAKVGRINFPERMNPGRSRLSEIMKRLVHDGWLRRGSLDAMVMSFMSPLIVWRQAHAIDADLPMIRHPRAFARDHVDQFLRGAAGPRAEPPARRAPRRRSS